MASLPSSNSTQAIPPIAATAPRELREMIQRALDNAQELHSTLARLPQTSGSTTPWELLVQAHTAHLLNHHCIVTNAAISFGSDDADSASAAMLQTMVMASEQLLGDARALHEHVLSLQLCKMRDAKSRNAPTAKSSRHNAPSGEDSDEDKATAAGRSDANHTMSDRHGKARQKEHAHTAKEENGHASPKRRFELAEEGAFRVVVKRAKLAPPDAPTPKRKSDVSMLDAEDAASSSPPGTRQGSDDSFTGAPQVSAAPAADVQIEYEDITAEVDARMQKQKERKEREMKHELGIADKRKRQSNDLLTVDLMRGEEGEKPSRKRKKR